MSAPSRPLPLASVSLDLDNLWSYLKTHGDPEWAARPSYLAEFVPLVLDLLQGLDTRITFFVVGIDAEQPHHASALRAITAHGHEVGNHSFEHEPWLHEYTVPQLRAEIERAETAIETATGQRPLGFRGPGYSWSPALLELLAERGYLFDASTLPTYLGPVARAYYLRTSSLGAAERATRARLFGTLRDGRLPLRPYRWRLPSGRSLLEMPVTTVPGIKVPFHLSYLLYLSRYSERAALAYLRTALSLCRAVRLSPSFLLHPLDLLGGDRVRELSFFPGMDLTSAYKARFFTRVVHTLQQHFTLVPMSLHAHSILAEEVLDERLAHPAPAAASAA
jgi:peptidoglycan/xylan/chitin deacetylase (PgdA/CDA1 family)